MRFRSSRRGCLVVKRSQSRKNLWPRKPPKAPAGAAGKKAAVVAAESKPSKTKVVPKAAAKAPVKAKATAKTATANRPQQRYPKRNHAQLGAPRKAGADDLKLISGVGPKLEGVLNELGFYHFDQIAKWTAAEIAWVDERLKFKGRIERDNWIDQATTLAAGGETAFSKKASK